MNALQLTAGKATAPEIERHLRECSATFVPALETRVDIAEYALKIAENAIRFEAWAGGGLVALVAVYDNAGVEAFVTNVSVAPACRGQGLAKQLLEACLRTLAHTGAKRVKLEVNRGNVAAIHLYETMGFKTESFAGDQIYMARQTEQK